MVCFFFFKQKTAYEMRISDWSSDVCSSDLWGSLEKFQRTRGVLRLMAQAIHELWMNGDPSVMIMPGSVAVSSPRVEPELLHYLDVTWQSIIAGDVDGTRSDEPRVGKACGSPFRSRRSPYH